MPNTYACYLVSNPNVPIFLPRVCTLVLFIRVVLIMTYTTMCAIMPLASLEALKNERVTHEVTYC